MSSTNISRSRDPGYPPCPIASLPNPMVPSDHMTVMQVSLGCPVDKALFSHTTTHYV